MRLAHQRTMISIVLLGLLSLVVTLGITYSIYNKTYRQYGKDLNDRMREAAETAEKSFRELATKDIDNRTLYVRAILRGICETMDMEELFIFDAEFRCIADQNENIRFGHKYLRTVIPGPVKRSIIEGEPKMHPLKKVDGYYFRTYGHPLIDTDTGNLVGGVFVQAKLGYEEEIEAIRYQWIAAAILTTLTTLFMIGLLAGIVHRSQRMQQEVNRRSRIDMIEMMSSGLLHEIKTPLATIDGSGQILRRRFGEMNGHEENTELAGFIVTEAGRIKEILDKTLSVDRSNEQAAIEIHDFLSMVQRSLYPTIKKKDIEVDNQIDKNIRVWAAPLLLRLVFSNILTNAVQAVPSQSGRIELRGHEDGQQFAVDIIDNGPGIARKKFNKIFEWFGSDKKGGTGIGLAAAAQAAEEMNGRIELQSKVGVGTTFTVWLPLAQVSVEPGGGERHAPTKDPE